MPKNPAHLRSGDVAKIVFPGAAEFTTTQKIREDGKLSLPLVGEVIAAGKGPGALQKELTKLYENELQLNEVVVTVESSPFAVYVTGAVLQPGKVVTEKPITALEAIMEAGGFDQQRANVKRVVVVRDKESERDEYVLNLGPVLKGNGSHPFYLEPYDKVYVPETLF